MRQVESPEGWCDVEANNPAPGGEPGADDLPIPPGDDYGYDEVHDASLRPLRETPAPRHVDPPTAVNVGEDGDYGYDEAHDFCV